MAENKCRGVQYQKEKIDEIEDIGKKTGMIATGNSRDGPIGISECIRPQPCLRPGTSKIEARRLQNRGPEPPKSSPEPSKTQFLKISNLRKIKTELP